MNVSPTMEKYFQQKEDIHPAYYSTTFPKVSVDTTSTSTLIVMHCMAVNLKRLAKEKSDRNIMRNCREILMVYRYKLKCIYTTRVCMHSLQV